MKWGILFHTCIHAKGADQFTAVNNRKSKHVCVYTLSLNYQYYAVGVKEGDHFLTNVTRYELFNDAVSSP